MAAHRRSPSAPPLDLEGQFKFEFNNYLRSALTLRGLSSVPANHVSRRGSAYNTHVDDRAAAGWD